MTDQSRTWQLCPLIYVCVFVRVCVCLCVCAVRACVYTPGYVYSFLLNLRSLVALYRYVGAMILKAHYRKFGDAWVVEQLFDDLLLWTNWIRDQRTDESNLVFLGTDNVPKEYSVRLRTRVKSLN